MPKIIEPGKKLKRFIKVYGIEGPVELVIAHEGLTLRVPGTKKHLTADWPSVVGAAVTPDDVPSHLFGEPLKFLQHEAEKVMKRKEKKGAQ
ncbi:MAG: hypothetical protein C5B59_06605 [Bacteroidetes bacterium]|nr:MAG: hypothetical protein C5B59_06605 [Bacteroidota bacterium]